MTKRTTFAVSVFLRDDDEIQAAGDLKWHDLRLKLGDLDVYLSRKQAYRVLSELENELSRRREAGLDENRERLAYEHKYDVAADDAPSQHALQPAPTSTRLDPDLEFEQDLEDQMREDETRRTLESA